MGAARPWRRAWTSWTRARAAAGASWRWSPTARRWPSAASTGRCRRRSASCTPSNGRAAPGHVSIDALDFEEIEGGTRIVSRTVFHTGEERDGMIEAGMEKGLNEGYEQLDELLAALG